MIVAMTLMFAFDTQSICADYSSEKCLITVDQCILKERENGTEPDEAFGICADEAEYNNWYK